MSEKKQWNSYLRLTSQIYPYLFQLIGSYLCLLYYRPNRARFQIKLNSTEQSGYLLNIRLLKAAHISPW